MRDRRELPREEIRAALVLLRHGWTPTRVRRVLKQTRTEFERDVLAAEREEQLRAELREVRA